MYQGKSIKFLFIYFFPFLVRLVLSVIIEAKPPDKEKLRDINKFTRINNKLSENDFGPFKVIVQSSLTNKNIGNYSILSIAKEIFNLNLENIKNIERKGHNRVSVEFKTQFS